MRHCIYLLCWSFRVTTSRNVAFSEERDLLCMQKVRNSCTGSDKYSDRKSNFVNSNFGLKECDFVYTRMDVYVRS